MSLFSDNGRACKFRLVNLPNDVSQEITKMILDNGGEIVDIDDPLVISFTVPDNYVLGEVMYDVEFIKDCVRSEEIGDLHKYKLGPKMACDECIMSIFSHGSAATNSPKSIDKNHPSLLQDELEVSPNSEKLQTDGNASSREASSIYETAEDSINSSGNNLSSTQAIQDGLDELHTDTESRTKIIVTQQMKVIDKSDLGSQRSVKRAVNRAKHKLHLDTSEIIHISSDSQSDQSWNLEERFSVMQSGNGYEISNLPDVERIRVANTSAKEHESHAKDESKKKAEKDLLIAYKLKIHKQGKQEFGETAVSNCIKNSLKSRRKNFTTGKENEENEKSESRARTNAKSAKKRSRISSEEEESPRSSNEKDHGRCDCGERKSEISRKGKKKPEKSLIKRKHFKSNLSSGSNIDVLAINDTNKNGKKSMEVPKRKSKLPRDNESSVDGNSTLHEDPESSEDSTVSLTDPQDIVSDQANRGLKRREALPNTSYATSTDDSDDVQEVARLVNDKTRSNKDDKEDEQPTASTSEFVAISHDSESSHHIKDKAESNNASHLPVRTGLNINRGNNGRPIQTNRDLKEWLRWAKYKVQTMAAPRMRNFAKWEKWHMLIFLIENDLIDRAKGLDTWQYMINREDCGHRTRMSLNNHFLKYVLPHIEEFHLPEDVQTKFVALRQTKGH